MGSRRISQETSKYFSTKPLAATTVAPRRSARVSLSRFAYREGSTTTTTDDAVSAEFTLGSDIEDAILPKNGPRRRRSSPGDPLGAAATSATTRKRKRTTTTTTAALKKEGSPATAVKTETEDLPVKTKINDAAPKPPRRARQPAKMRTDPATGATKVEAPTDWEEMYALVKEMRLTGPAANAAVDTMGCERLASADASPRDRRFHTLIALMLSSQTKDTVNAAAMARLKAELPPHREGAPAGLNLENVLAVEPAVLNGLIYQVGFHNNKTKYIKQAAVILRDKWAGDIPDTIEGLTSLPGVGPKMAHLCMSAPNGWGRVEGIGVDVHVHRITNLWGWNRTANPEATRASLESWLPRDRWREVNWLLVGLGQTVCLPVGRRCGDCELGLRGLCGAADRKKVFEGRRRRSVKATVTDELLKMEADGVGGGEEVKVVAEKAEEELVETVVKEEAVNEDVPVSIKDEFPDAPTEKPAKTRRRR